MSRPLGDPPVCDCHGEPQRWNTDRRKKTGGQWRCSVKEREYRRRHYEENRDKELAAIRRWRDENPDKERESNRRWREANPDKRRESNARRLRVGGMYLGMVGFTQQERKEMIHGKAD